MGPEFKKIIAVVALLVLSGGLLVYFNRSPSPLADSIEFVCVATGKTYRIDREDLPGMFPAENPDTGERTLLPVKTEDGKRIAIPRYAHEALRDPELAKVNKYVDPQTFEILETPR